MAHIERSCLTAVPGLNGGFIYRVERSIARLIAVLSLAVSRRGMRTCSRAVCNPRGAASMSGQRYRRRRAPAATPRADTQGMRCLLVVLSHREGVWPRSQFLAYWVLQP